MYAFIHSATNPIGFSSQSAAVELTFSSNGYFEVAAGINMLLCAGVGDGDGSIRDEWRFEFAGGTKKVAGMVRPTASEPAVWIDDDADVGVRFREGCAGWVTANKNR